MEIIIHRINKIDKLKKIPIKYGVEIDIRSYKNDLILSHDPYKYGDDFYQCCDRFIEYICMMNDISKNLDLFVCLL